MTIYTAIADSEIDPESPGTTTLFTKLRDNPIAITEKAAGAPVLANNYIVTAMVADGQITNPKLAAPTSGTTYLIGKHDAGYTGAVGSPGTDTIIPELSIGILLDGTVTVYAEHRNLGSSGNVYLTFYKNGAAASSTFSTTSSTFVARQVNISVAVGDVISVVYHVQTGTDQSDIRNFRLYSGTKCMAGYMSDPRY